MADPHRAASLEAGEGRTPTKDEFAAARESLATNACAPFDNPDLRQALATLKTQSEQTIDRITIDTVIEQDFSAAAKEEAESLTRDFRAYIEEHKAEIEALQILYSRPYKKASPKKRSRTWKPSSNKRPPTGHRTPSGTPTSKPNRARVKGQVKRFEGNGRLARLLTRSTRT